LRYNIAQHILERFFVFSEGEPGHFWIYTLMETFEM
jgi:hypothetical protein